MLAAVSVIGTVFLILGLGSLFIGFAVGAFVYGCMN